MDLKKLSEKIINGGNIDKEEALELCKTPLDQLCIEADNIRKHFCSDIFDICTIINGKSGMCSENCKFCAQSAHSRSNILSYPLLSKEEIINQARINKEAGVLRYSIVTSGRRLPEHEIEKMCEAVEIIKDEIGISVCASFGLLDAEQFKKLKAAGIERIHNNLETSRNFFENICTTHTYDEKISAIKAAHAAGLSVCSGGIMGLGESWEDRIDMALELRELGIKSVPVNVLNPIKGTPLENNEPLKDDEIARIIAIYRFILPDASIRLAGGRGLMDDRGERCFTSGANAAITGDMLTTAGITVKSDIELIERLGFKIGFHDE